MSENPTGSQPVLQLTISLPGVYTADLEKAMEDFYEFGDDEDADISQALLSALNIGLSCGVRFLAIGEKDAEMVQIRGKIVGARLTEAA